ncbi:MULTISPECIES: hypothetical protein [Fluviispira]|uniref:Uncharacterized protein n=1 Tax=Fluviispira sanaruensis TaxID=2493639 RepID=A0A4P2VQP0_FLUSA|nr:MULTISPECIES: hypothetical protein [Fluviispira]BBH54379.1 hypothetical protein JCM31447_28430 [Fluviispira sanaruensis]
MNFEYLECKDKNVINHLNKLVKNSYFSELGVFYLSFSKYDEQSKVFTSVCSSEELKQEIKARGKLKSSPVCRNNRLSSINQIITYDDITITDPSEEIEIIHRQNNGYKSLVSLNITNDNIKYSFNITSNLTLVDSRIIYFRNREIIGKYFNNLKLIFDSLK